MRRLGFDPGSGRRRVVRRTGWLLALLSLLSHAYLYRAFLVIEPGATGPAWELVRVAGSEVPPAGGELIYATVDAGRAGLAEAFRALVDPVVELRRVAREVPPGLTWEEYAGALRESMQESQRVAAVVALRHLGYRVRLDEEVLPVEIEPAGDAIGGTSAALVVALEVYRQVTGIELDGGVRIAGTGDLRPDGRVEVVAGVRQKAVAAERAGAALFLVPRANAAEAASVARNMRVVPVDTFEQAVAVLRSAGREEYPGVRGI